MLTENGDMFKGCEIAYYYENSCFLNTEIWAISPVFRCFSETGLFEIADILCNNGSRYSSLSHWLSVENKFLKSAIGNQGDIPAGMC